MCPDVGYCNIGPPEHAEHIVDFFLSHYQNIHFGSKQKSEQLLSAQFMEKTPKDLFCFKKPPLTKAKLFFTR